MGTDFPKVVFIPSEAIFVAESINDERYNIKFLRLMGKNGDSRSEMTLRGSMCVRQIYDEYAVLS